jgi:cell division septal protein FtsQ
MAVSAPTDKRFRRVHVSPARKRRWFAISRKHLVYLAVAAIMMAFGIRKTAAYMLSSDALIVSRITVNGNARLPRGEIVSLLDGLEGRNMLRLDLDGWRNKLLASPWVADAALHRVLPGTVDVFITEREPIGIGRLGDLLYLIDEQGDVIDEFGPNHADLDLPVIDGLGAPGVDPRLGGEAVDQGRALLATRLLSSLQARPDLADRISQVDVSDARDAVVLLKDDSTLIRIGDDEFAKRLQSYIDLAPALRERVPDIDYVDLRFGERVYVRPQGSVSQKVSNGG